MIIGEKGKRESIRVKAIINGKGNGCVGGLVELPGIDAEGNTSGQALGELQSTPRRLLAMEFSVDVLTEYVLTDIPTESDQ